MGIRCPCSAVAVVVIFAVVVAQSPEASAQVYKCVDRAGRVTYQQGPCAEAQKGSRLDLYLGNSSTHGGAISDEEWAARAGRKDVMVGMPRAFVIKALGIPQEMRPGRSAEKAVEVWHYRRSDLEMVLGFNRGVIAWINDIPQDAAQIPMETSRRQQLGLGRGCDELTAELGSPSRTFEALDDAMGRIVQRMQWDPDPSDAETTVVSCVEGKIARVDRTPTQEGPAPR